MSGGVGGQVLGASTLMAAGIAVLPGTGNSTLAYSLTILAIALGGVCIISLVVTRLLRKII